MNKERLRILFDESKYEVEMALGINLKTNITCSISTRSKSRLGVCKNKRNIEISSYMFNFDDNTIKNTIIHEILHTIDGSKGHDKIWINYAKIINNKYSHYNIKRLADMNEICSKNNVSRKDVIKSKYEIKCNHCNHSFNRNRLSDYQKNYINTKLKCSKCNGSMMLIL